MNCRTVFRSSVLSLVCAVSAVVVHGQVEKQKGVEANRELVRRAFQAFEAGDVTTINAIFAPDGPMHGRREATQGGPYAELKGACGMCASLRGRSIRIEQMVADGEMVAVRSRWSGLYTGAVHGAQVKDKKVSVVYTNFYRIAGGRIVENWYLADNMTLAEQLGFSMTAPASGGH